MRHQFFRSGPALVTLYLQWQGLDKERDTHVEL